MSHNINRKPNYPPKDKKGKKRTPKTVFERIQNGWQWLCLLIVFAGWLIWIPCKITYNQIQRHRVNKDPVETEAVITGFGKPISLGTPVYYEYRVGDSVYTGDSYQKRKILQKLHVGQTIHIKYENGNPSNAFWDYLKKI